MDCEEVEEFEDTSTELMTITNETASNILPEESKEVYEAVYRTFEEWRKEKQVGISEEVLLEYFNEISVKYKPSSLWSKYSILKTTIKHHNDVDLGNYSKLLAFLKCRSKGYKPQKAKELTNEDLKQFLTNAPDQIYLATKVSIIFAITGALRIDDLTRVQMKDLEDHGKIFLVRIPNAKTKTEKSFTIHDEEYYNMVKRYLALRPPKLTHQRVFLNFHNNRCSVQPIGKNKFAAMPKQIAKYLGLPDLHLYTGHSFRRSSTTMLADAGAIKRHSAWKLSRRHFEFQSKTRKCDQCDLQLEVLLKENDELRRENDKLKEENIELKRKNQSNEKNAKKVEEKLEKLKRWGAMVSSIAKDINYELATTDDDDSDEHPIPITIIYD